MDGEFQILSREPRYPPIKDGDEVAYLVLHVGVPSTGWPARSVAELEGVKSAQKAGVILGIKLWPMRLTWPGRRPGEYRYFFRFPRFRKDDQHAQRIAECFLYALAATSGPFLGRIEEAAVFRVPADLVRRCRSVVVDKLIQVEEARPFDTRTLASPGLTLGSSTTTGGERFDAAWKITPTIVQNEGLRRAVRFLKASQDDFFVWPGQVGEVLAKPDMTASTGFEQTALENALQNAFKAVEAVLGDPPKDGVKFRAKMAAIGLDPDEEVGYGDKAPLQTVVRGMSLARDKKAAHGSTLPRAITVGELMEFQACAQLIVLAAIEKVMGEPIYP